MLGQNGGVCEGWFRGRSENEMGRREAKQHAAADIRWDTWAKAHTPKHATEGVPQGFCGLAPRPKERIFMPSAR